MKIMVIRLPFGIRIVIGKEHVLTPKDLSKIDLTKAQQVPNKIVDQMNRTHEEKRDKLIKSLRKPLDWRSYIGRDLPPDHPVTENTIKVTKDWGRRVTAASDD